MIQYFQLVPHTHLLNFLIINNFGYTLSKNLIFSTIFLHVS